MKLSKNVPTLFVLIIASCTPATSSSSSSVISSSDSLSSVQSSENSSSETSSSVSATSSSTSSSSSSSGVETVNLALMSAPLYVPAISQNDCVSYKVWDLEYAIKYENHRKTSISQKNSTDFCINAVVFLWGE